MLNLVIVEVVEQMVNAVQTCAFLVYRLHHPPRGFWDMCTLDHGFFGHGVVFPAAAAF